MRRTLFSLVQKIISEIQKIFSFFLGKRKRLDDIQKKISEISQNFLFFRKKFLNLQLNLVIHKIFRNILLNFSQIFLNECEATA